MTSCYVHVPFCSSICSYCDFCRRVADQPTRLAWLEQIQKEIRTANVPPVQTLYLGGGTPNCLKEEMIHSILSLFAKEEGAEWTIECNPEWVTDQQIRQYKEWGINRISLGVQSFQDDILRRIGRHHTARQAITAIETIRQAGIQNLSIDLMYGLPGQRLEDLKEDVETFLSLNLEHCSIYSLQIEENSVFGKQGLTPIDAETEAEMYEWIVQRLTQAGYRHYEISSFAKEGYESQHNLVYWQDKDFYGFGCGASGRLHTDRYDNTNDLSSYIKDGPQPTWIQESLQEKGFNAIMMGLRTQFGVDLTRWQESYQHSLLEEYQAVIQKYEGEYLVVEKDALRCTSKGFEILNTILVDFLSAH